MPEIDLSDHDGRITATSGFTPEGPEPSRGDYEIGIEDGEGYLKLVIGTDTIHEFSLSVEEVERYTEHREEVMPSPKVPDGFSDEKPAPDGFTGGKTVHTGGGIWCRIWQKELESGRIEVMYGVPDCSGGQAGVYGPEGAWLGELTTFKTRDEATDENAFADAMDVMKSINEGMYDQQISELLDEHK